MHVSKLGTSNTTTDDCSKMKWDPTPFILWSGEFKSFWEQRVSSPHQKCHSYYRIFLFSSSSLAISVQSEPSRWISCWCWESSRGGDPVLSLSACSNSYSCQVHISTLFFPPQIFHLEHPATVTHHTFLCPELNEPFTNLYFLPIKVFLVTIK